MAPTTEARTTEAPTTEPSAAPPASAELLAFLRRNSLLRGNEEGRSLCERSVDLASGKAPMLWILETHAAATGDFFLLCARTTGPFGHIDVTMSSPTGQIVVDTRLTADPTHTIFTTSAPSPGLALVGRIKGDHELHFVGMTEPTQDVSDPGWIAQVTLLLAEQRPEGAWRLTSAVDGTVTSTTTVPVADHCDRAAPRDYVGPNPLIVDPNTRVVGVTPVTAEENCRVIGPFVGADFAATAASLLDRTNYGEFRLQKKDGNCGLPIPGGSPWRDNHPGLVEETVPPSGYAYQPGDTVTVLRTISCPAFPEALMELRPASNGLLRWEAKPLPIADVAKALDALAVGYPDWQWGTDATCGPTSTVARFEGRERGPLYPGFTYQGFPGLLVPQMTVYC